MRFSKKIIIIITIDSNLTNYRASKIYELRNYFDEVIIVAKKGEIGNNRIVIGKYLNILRLLNFIGLSRLKSSLEKIFFFPNSNILFVNKAKKILKKLLNKIYLDSITTVLVITPPHTNAILGYYLKFNWPNIKLIIDWQDLWTYDEYHLNKTFFLYHNKLRKLEKDILSIADMNVLTNEYAVDLLKTEFKINKSKITYIYHPFDKKELQNHKENKSENHKINIGFLGHLIKPPKVSGEKLLDAVEYCFSCGLDLEFNIFGDEQKITRALISKKDYNFVKLHKRVSHEESINKLIGCDFLLLCLEDLPNTKIIMHGKLSHYLLLKKPIVAFVPDDSFVANLIRKTNSGFVITAEQHWGKEFHKILTEFDYAKYLKNRNEEEIEKFSWENISKEWLKVFSLVHKSN